MLPPKEEIERLRNKQNERFVNPDTGDISATFGPPEFDDEEGLEQELAPIANERRDGFDIPEFTYEANQWSGVKEGAPDTTSLKQDGNGFIEEDVVFPGGPLRTEVASWKKQFEINGHTVNLSEIGDELFIWRTLNRVEYREIMAIPNTDPLQREEIICEVCVLYPYDYNFKSMSERKAGVPALLAEQIMKESAFSKIAPPIRL